MEEIYQLSNRLITNISDSFQRYLYHQVDYTQRLIEITGSRGVGKTTMMLQKAKELSVGNPASVLYVSLDDMFFYQHSLLDLADYFVKYGGKYLFVDEVHKYPPKHNNFDWSSEVKNIYDRYPELTLIYSGSSIINLYKGNGDLSRRKSSYRLNGFSFREYLSYNNIIDLPQYSLYDIIESHPKISSEITKEIKILIHFKNYIKHGYYPFYNENPAQYQTRIKDVVNLILEVDIPAIAEISHATIGKIKTMIAVLSTSVPYTPNISNLAQNLNISDLRTIYKYFHYLERAEIISQLKSTAKANKMFQKPNKIYLNNTNLSYVFSSGRTDVGTIRETFFLNQVGHLHNVNYYEKTDFKIDDKLLFEVGGKNKKKKQIRELEKAYVVKDDIETGFTNVIPLWLVGLLY